MVYSPNFFDLHFLKLSGSRCKIYVLLKRPCVNGKQLHTDLLYYGPDSFSVIILPWFNDLFHQEYEFSIDL